MWIHPGFDPIALSVGSLHIRWYGIMYLVAFIGGWLMAQRRGPREANPWTADQLSDLLFYLVIGVIVGGRLGYSLFYSNGQWFKDPLYIFRIWEGGMSFHGGLAGVLLAILVYAKVYKRQFLEISDFIAPFFPFGLLTGRIGNFINAELWGRATDAPWGMVFPLVDQQARHPTPLYEAALEGALLLVILNWLARKPQQRGLLSGAFLLGYGLCRFFVEFFREPDAQIGFLFGNWLTMGMILCLPMIVGGFGLLAWALSQAKKTKQFLGK